MHQRNETSTNANNNSLQLYISDELALESRKQFKESVRSNDSIYEQLTNSEFESISKVMSRVFTHCITKGKILLL